MSVIKIFVTDTHDDMSQCTNLIVLYIICFSPLYQILNIKIWYMVMRKHPRVFEDRKRFSSIDVIKSGEANYYSVVDHDGADLNKDYCSSLS